MHPDQKDPWHKPPYDASHNGLPEGGVYSNDRAHKNPIHRLTHALSWNSLKKLPWRVQRSVIRRGGLFAIGAGLSCLLIIVGVAAGALTILGYSPASVLTGHLTRIDQTDTNGTSVGGGGGGTNGTGTGGGSQGGDSGNQGGQGGDGGGGGGKSPGNVGRQDNPAGPAVPNEDAVFSANACGLSHSSQDDPILYPGQPGAAHLHDFYGNVTTNAYSTTASLTGQHSTCGAAEPLDASAYWIPALGIPNSNEPDGIQWIHAGQVGAYYSYGGTDNTPLAVQFPIGLRMIAGNSKGTSELNTDFAYFICVYRDDHTRTVGQAAGHIITCPPDYKIVGSIAFPDCWDGVWLYENGGTHMVYSGGSPSGGPDCPADHPIKLPQLNLRIHWNFQGSDNAFLSSDLMTTAGKNNHGRSLHGDVWDAWDPGRFKKLVATCLNSGKGMGCPEGGKSGQKEPPPYETLPPPYTEGQEPYQGLGFDLTRPSSTQSFASVNTKEVACASQSWWQQLLSLFTRTCEGS